MSKETIEEAAERDWTYNEHKFEDGYDPNRCINGAIQKPKFINGFIKGAAWQAERMYSDFDVMDALHSVELKDNKNYTKIYNGMKEWFDQNKKQKP